jgi:hypothetical protein
MPLTTERGIVPTLDEVLTLLHAKEERPAGTAKWFDGVTWHYSKPQGTGSFQGRAGSIRRSSKGRTRRVANGKRKYIIDYDSTVVAYRP